jgi:hypothetical protein
MYSARPSSDDKTIAILQMKKQRLLPDIVCCLIAICVPLALQGALRIWSPQPLSLGGDHAFFLSDLKQMAMGQGFWSSEITGFPYGQIDAYFPTFEPLFRLILWIVASTGVDVFTATKIFYVIGIGAMGAACFACLRALSIGPIFAAVGAVAFTLSPYFQLRALNHDMLSIYVSAAFGAAFSIMIAKTETADEFRKLAVSPLFIIGMIIVATSGLYYAMFSLLLMGIAILSLVARTGRVEPLAIFGGISALVFIALLVGALGPYLSIFLSGAPKRFPVEQFWHGLSISDSMYAFDWIHWVHKHTSHYDLTRPTTLVGEGHHEWPGAVLTLTILVCPLIVLWGIGRTNLDQRIRTIVLAAALICFILIFASRGGLGYLVNELINPSLRAQARIMPLLMFMAIFIVLAAAEYTWASGRKAGRIVVACIIGAILTSSWSARGVLIQHQTATATNPAIQATVASFKALDAAKDRVGVQAILQLPITTWPEAPFRNGYDFYPMRYGFLFDRSDSPTKWSYGVSDRQEGFAKLDAAFKAGFEPADLVKRARSFGYDSILVEKRPYLPTELQSIEDGIAASLPKTCRIYDDADRALYDVGRAPECRLENGRN